MMNNIKELICDLPDGKKRNYLGQLFVKALSDYYANFGVDEEIDLDELLVRNIKDIIIKDDLLKDLKLFASEKLEILFNLSSNNVSKLSINNLRTKLISHFEIKFEIDQTADRNYENNSICKVPLHDFQDRIRRKVINLIFNNQKRFLIHMPTGSGKTRTAAEVILDFIRLSSSKSLLNDKIKILWIAQSSELCYQAYETVKLILDHKGTQNISLANYYGNQELPDDIEDKSAIIFCGIQKLLLHYKDDIWKKIKNNTYLVIVDEAHRSVANQWVQALDYFVSDQSVYLLGLTATPGLGTVNEDKTFLLSTYYQSNKITITDSNYEEISNPINELVKLKFLAQIKRIDIDSKVVIKNGADTSDENEIQFSNNTLDQLTANQHRNASIINIIKENHSKKKKMLVFTCGLEHNRILKSILTDLDIASETIDQSTTNRNSIIDKFKDSNSGLDILLNYGILTTGFDAPKTDVCIIARPISSIVMYSQMVGRILRGPKNNGNDENTLYTIKDNLGHGDYDNLFNSFNNFYK
jgi:DNA repair protein RadD